MRMGLPASIIRQYGVTKKAWAVFRGKRSTPASPRRKGHFMAKRRRTGGFMRRAKRAYTKHRSKINELAIVATAFIEPYVDSIINSFSTVAGGLTNILKLIAAYFLKKKSGMVGSIAQTIYVIEIYKLARGFAGGGLGGLLPGAAGQDTYM